jgi:hypothetical protein
MRREGGWIRVYRAHHKADTMVTAGHIAKAMRDIDEEARKNDWVRAIIDVPGVGGGVVNRLAELELPSCPTTAARHRSTRNDSSTLERRTSGHCASGSSRAKLILIPMTTSSLLSSVRSSGHRLPRPDQDRIEGRHA